MNVSIRKGYNVWSTESERVKELKKLESQEILSLKQDDWQTCRKCKTQNIIDEKFRLEKVSTCSNCGRTITLRRTALIRYTVSGLNYQNIITICDKKLTEALGTANCTYDKDRRIWICSCDNKKIPVFISQVSSFNQYLGEQTDSGWLCVLLDWEAEKGILNYYNQVHFVRIEDILNDRIKLDETINVLATSFTASVPVELAQKFDTVIGSMRPSEFEKKFVDRFLSGIRERVGSLQSFFNFLSTRKNTITNSKVILIGGPTNPDFAVINLLDYLQEGLRPDKIGEAKRYFRSTSFTVSDFGTAQAHAIGADTVSIVSTNRIQPGVWRLILETRNKEGYFKHVLMEKDTILLLINILKMDDLLS